MDEISLVIDSQTQRIWRHTRKYRNSMDSEIHCKVIREAIQDSIAEIAGQNKTIQSELDIQRKVNKDLRKQLKTTMEDLGHTAGYLLGMFVGKDD